MSSIRRTYRVEVSGQFDRPVGDVRQGLIDAQRDHERTAAAFTADGTLTYSASLTRFMFRYLIEVEESSAVEADGMAVLMAELRAQDYLAARDIPSKGTHTTATCLEDLKIRRNRKAVRSHGSQ